ncbi:MAG: IS1380 family transposase [Solirubrobacterales bacterium]
MRFTTTHSRDQEDTRKVNAKASAQTVEVTADGPGLVSHAGAYLITELANRVGLTAALSGAMAPTRERRSAHDPGAVLRDLAVSVADGGDCLSDLGVLRGQESLFGRVASETTAHRVVKSIDGAMLERIRAARARARVRAWDAGARPETITFNIDATLLAAHSEKEEAAGNYKGGFGFHPLCCYLDETDEPLAAILRPGNAGANTAADHFEVLQAALEQIPEQDLGREMLVRADVGGSTHDFTHDCRDADIRFSVGYAIDERLRTAIAGLPEPAWTQAIEADGAAREGAWVAELTDSLELAEWPEGIRAIVRRERPHPGAQLSIFDCEAGYRHTCFLTDQQAEDIAALELRHRGRARVEDEIRCGKDCGMRNLPFGAFAANQVWLELSLIAQELLAWTRSLCLEGTFAVAEPKRLRQRLLHVAGRIARSGRRLRLRLQADWPWAEALAAAFRRLRSLPAPAPP